MALHPYKTTFLVIYTFFEFITTSGHESCADLSNEALSIQKSSKEVLECTKESASVVLSFNKVNTSWGSNDSFEVGLASGDYCSSIPSFEVFSDLLKQNKVKSVCKAKCQANQSYLGQIDSVGQSSSVLCILIFCKNSTSDCKATLTVDWKFSLEIVPNKAREINTGVDTIDNIKVVNLFQEGENNQAGAGGCELIEEVICKMFNGSFKNCKCASFVIGSDKNGNLNVLFTDYLDSEDTGLLSVKLKMKKNEEQAEELESEYAIVGNVVQKLNIKILAIIFLELVLGGFAIYKIRDNYRISTAEKNILDNDAEILSINNTSGKKYY